ncbi:MAG: hypothetical protein FH753_15585 [Firmicutes bacterium]|nr:hypothetical protein [Bacillota bacterium]
MEKKNTVRIVFIFLIVVIVYKIPSNIDKNYKGYILYCDDININININKKINIHLKGKLSKKVFSDDYFVGEIIFNDIKMNVKSAIPGNIKMRLKGLKSKLKREEYMVCGINIDNGTIKTTGVVHFSRNFKKIWGYSQEMREKYKDTDVIFVAPAENKSEAKTKIEELNYTR